MRFRKSIAQLRHIFTKPSTEDMKNMCISCRSACKILRQQDVLSCAVSGGNDTSAWEAVAKRNAFLTTCHDGVGSDHFRPRLPRKSLVCQTSRSLPDGPRCSCEPLSSTIFTKYGVSRQAPRRHASVLNPRTGENGSRSLAA